MPRQRDAEHQPKVPQRVMKPLRQRMLRPIQKVPHPLTRELPEEVVIACGSAPVFGFVSLIDIFYAQIGVLAQLAAQVG